MAPTPHTLRVLDVTPETADSMSVSFEVPPEAQAQFAYRPGQFLTLAVPSDQSGIAARCYSLSSSPGDARPITITVKRTAGGYASNWICDHLCSGATIDVLPPSGAFTPTDLDADLLLLAAGSGITPLMSILRAKLARTGGVVTLFYANRDQDSVIFSAELNQLAQRHPARLTVMHWLESERGLPETKHLREVAAQHSTHDAFVCGPPAFMTIAASALRQQSFPRSRMHQERFISLTGNPFGTAAQRAAAHTEMSLADTPPDAADVPGDTVTTTVKVTIGEQTHVWDDWLPTRTLLEHLEAKGIDAPYSCREGECSTCAVQITDGDVTMDRNDVLDQDDLDDGLRLACQARPASSTVHATYET